MSWPVSQNLMMNWLLSLLHRTPQDESSATNGKRRGDISLNKNVNGIDLDYFEWLPIIVNIPQDNCSPGQLYSKLFDEVDKIKFWKVKVDSDNVQNERKHQENKRTIETQRKAIQELQVCILIILIRMSFSLSPHFLFSCSKDYWKKSNGTLPLSLQFGNESLSVKLEEQISENEDLRNK